MPESASHSNNIEKQFSFRKSYYDIKQFFYKYFLDQEFTYNSEKLLFDTYYDLCFNKYNDAYRKKMVEIYMKNHFPDRKSRLLFYLSKKSFIFHLFIVLNRIRLLRKS